MWASAVITGPIIHPTKLSLSNLIIVHIHTRSNDRQPRQEGQCAYYPAVCLLGSRDWLLGGENKREGAKTEKKKKVLIIDESSFCSSFGSCSFVPDKAEHTLFGLLGQAASPEFSSQHRPMTATLV